ncbi:MAG TPA: hypothetical protein VJ579_01080 [Candidatus Paceibacterota bacterium]|nr:hypothetical protein [Candidatus Paceibacterota bacterium]
MSDPAMKRTERAEQLMSDLALHICEEGGQIWLDELELFMKKQICWVIDRTPKKERTDPLLLEQYSAHINNPITSFKEFLEHGAVRNQRCFFDANFTGWFGTYSAKTSSPCTLRCKELQESANDHDLIAALGGENAAEVPLSIFFGALITPVDGSPSVFGESDVLHIFYARDNMGILRAITVACKNGSPRFISAHSLISNARWDKGRRVFSI